MSKKHPDTYTYTENEFIQKTAPWKDKNATRLSKFDEEVRERWQTAMESGVFRYNIDHIITRILPGDKQYVAQLNELRATERRKPQVITSVKQPFKEEAFNFTWVKQDEIIFDLKKSQIDQSKEKTENGVNGVSQTHLKPPSSESRHSLIVNVSPMEFGHCLLVPHIDCHSPQVLTIPGLELAIETMLLSEHRGFRMGFNSLCAFASVNHLHFHAYYLAYELIIDYCDVHKLGGPFYEMTAIPCPGFGIQLHGKTVQEMARLAYKISDYFHTSDIAHNLFMCRGTVFGEDRDSSNTTIRLYLWPRRKFIGTKSSDEFNVACIELGGHLPFKEEAGYHTMTEAEVDEIIADACLPASEYEKIREDIVKMGVSEEGQYSC